MFFITTFVKLDQDKLGWLDTGGQRTPAYYPEYQMAVDALHENRCDIREYTYDYACIEDIDYGMYQYDSNPQFFKWNDELKGFYEIDRPEATLHNCGFAIG